MPSLVRFHDATLYWVSAKSLAQGSSYRILSLPGEPFQTKYPPLYPLAASLIWRLNPHFPENLPLATLFCWLSLPAFLLLARPALVELGLGKTHIRVLLVLLALNPYVLLYATNLMSELPSVCLLFGCLVVATRAGRPGAPLRLAALAGALAGAAYLTRTAALPLLASAPLWFLLRRQGRRAAVFAASMLPFIAGWNIWVRQHAPVSVDPALRYYVDYLGYYFANFGWRDLPVVVSKNLADMLTAVGGLFVPVEMVRGIGGATLVGLAGVAVLYSVVRLAWERGISQYHLFAAGCVAALLPWEMGNTERFVRLLFPVLPLFLAGVTNEFRRAGLFAATLLRSARTALLAAFGPLLAVMGFAGIAAIVANGLMLATFSGFAGAHRSLMAQYRGAYAWIGRSTPPDALVLSDADALLYLYTGRHGYRLFVPTRLLYYGGRAEVLRFAGAAPQHARAHGLSYVLYEKLEDGGQAIGGEPVAAPRDLVMVYENPRVALYAVRKSASIEAQE